MKQSKQPSALDMLVGKRIKTQRLVCKMSQTELGNRLGITFQQIQKYEKGVNRVGAGRLQTIAAIFRVPVSFFYGEDKASQRASEESLDTIFKFLNTSRAIKLVKDFSRIKDPTLQLAVVSLVEKIANKTR